MCGRTRELVTLGNQQRAAIVDEGEDDRGGRETLRETTVSRRQLSGLCRSSISHSKSAQIR